MMMVSAVGCVDTAAFVSAAAAATTTTTTTRMEEESPEVEPEQQVQGNVVNAEVVQDSSATIMDGRLSTTRTKTDTSFVLRYKPLNNNNNNNNAVKQGTNRRRNRQLKQQKAQRQRDRRRVAAAAAAAANNVGAEASAIPITTADHDARRRRIKSSSKSNSSFKIHKHHYDIFAKTSKGGKGFSSSSSSSYSKKHSQVKPSLSKKKKEGSRNSKPSSPSTKHSPKKSSKKKKKSHSSKKAKGKGHYYPTKGKGKGKGKEAPPPSNRIWQSIPPIITGDAVGDEAGRSVSYSRDGSVLAIGLPGSKAATNTSSHANATGLVRVYRLEKTNSSWVQLGPDIRPPQSADRNETTTPFRFGQAIDLNHNGLIIAIGAPGFNDNRGIAYSFVYLERVNSWEFGGINNGVILAGTEVGESLGSSIAISSSGDVVVIGSPKKSRATNSAMLNAGQVSAVLQPAMNAARRYPYRLMALSLLLDVRAATERCPMLARLSRLKPRTAICWAASPTGNCMANQSVAWPRVSNAA
jgi:hypothetical protein